MGLQVWSERSRQNDLRVGIDPGDTRGIKNQYIDSIHRAALAQFCTIEPEEVVLDFGCGTGRFTAWLAARGQQVIGLDLVFEMVQAASRRHALPNTGWVVGSGDNLPWDSETFDKVLATFVLQHILEDAVLSKVLAEFHRVLKPKGQIVLMDQLRTANEQRVESYIRRRLQRDYEAALGQADMRVKARVPLRVHSVLSQLIAAGIVPWRWTRYAARIDAKLAASTRPDFTYREFLYVAEKLI